MSDLPYDPKLQAENDALRKERDALIRELAEMRRKNQWLEQISEMYTKTLQRQMGFEYIVMTREELDELEKTGCSFEQILADLKAAGIDQ